MISDQVLQIALAWELRIAMPIGGFKLREVTGDALIYPLKTSLHLGLGEVLVPCIDRLEL
jgi:hypothetical protein